MKTEAIRGRPMAAPIPDSEPERLAELESYRILDTPPEQMFDDITLLASQIFEMPIAVLSLIDRDRQWFKSSVGLDVPETHRDLAFCAHAVWDPSEVLVVEDAAYDPRFANHPMVVSEPSIRFYAGAPLMSATGNALGTLCVIDRVAHEMNPEQTRALEALARLTMSQLDMRRAILDLNDQLDEASDDQAA